MNTDLVSTELPTTMFTGVRRAPDCPLSISAPSTRRGRNILVVSFVSILLLAAGLRFWNLDREGRSADEYWRTAAYSQSIRSVVWSAQEQGQPPLAYLIGWTLCRVFGPSDWMMRFPEAMFGVIGVGACFLLVNRLVSWPQALLASLLLAVSPTHWSLSQHVRPYTMGLNAMLLTLWAFDRALGKPTWKRLLLFGACAYFFAQSRGALPLVFLLCAGTALTVSLTWMRLRGEPWRSEAGICRKRMWWAILAVSIAAIPMPASFFDPGLSKTIFGTLIGLANRRACPFLGDSTSLGDFLAKNALVWFDAAGSLLGPAYPVIAAFALLGVVICVRKQRIFSSASRHTIAIMVSICPSFLLVFSTGARMSAMNVAYGLFVVPVVFFFAAVGVVWICLWLARVINLGHARLSILVGALVVAMVAPSVASISEDAHKYLNADWRGCALFLESRMHPEDTVITFEDRPLGAGWWQPLFWGKHEWDANNRPLAESAWVLANSESHWQRFCKQTGRCYVVLHYWVDKRESADAYLRYGLSKPPGGMEMVKFRKLDLLFDSTSIDDSIAHKIDTCNQLIDLPKNNPGSNGILYALRSRLELLAGDVEAAADSLQRGREVVGKDYEDWFDSAFAVHSSALQQAAEAE